MNLSGRRALITGATGGLGKVFAETLAELGANVILLDRPGSNFDLQKENLEKKWGVDVQVLTCDLEIESERSEAVATIKSSERGLNILVNNAALVGSSDLLGWSVPFAEQSIATWRRAIEINLTAVFDLCQGLLPLLSQAEGANIINIASIYGSHAPDWKLYEGTRMGNPAAYGVSKSGLIQLTRWLSATVSPEIRVNAISPGGIFRDQPSEFINRYIERTSLKRMATEDDFRGILAYLSSDLSKYTTGQVITIDGGWGN